MSQFNEILEIVTIIGFWIYLYKKSRKPKLEIVETEKPVKKKKKPKYLRRFKLPYRGKTNIYNFDKKTGYIESAWNEVEKPKKK